MAQIFCIANQKGGVGKTTTAVNLAGALALKGRRVLFIDLDPQGNGTMGCGIEKRDLKGSIYEVLLGIASFEQAVRHRSKPLTIPTDYARIFLKRMLFSRW